MNKQNQFADVLASADTVLIPKNLYPKNATFDIDFAKNSMVLVYTNTSKGAATINADNWYNVLATKVYPMQSVIPPRILQATAA